MGHHDIYPVILRILESLSASHLGLENTSNPWRPENSLAQGTQGRYIRSCVQPPRIINNDLNISKSIEILENRKKQKSCYPPSRVTGRKFAPWKVIQIPQPRNLGKDVSFNQPPSFKGELAVKLVIWKGKKPILRGQKRSPWLLITYKSWDDPPSKPSNSSLSFQKAPRNRKDRSSNTPSLRYPQRSKGLVFGLIQGKPMVNT